MAEIRLEKVTKRFAPRSGFGARQADQRLEEDGVSLAQAGDMAALDGVSLTIPNGETIALVGPSGCGKSTLLRVVAGLEGDYTGQVYYDNQEMGEIPPKDRHIGMVFQNYALYPHFEGHGNLAFFFRLRKISNKEMEERIRITSEIMGIGFNALLQRKPGTLSGGQQQRVAIGRAIVRNPRLFLFDEPLSNLDAKLRTQTRVEIKRLLHRFHITAIYVTHDQVEAIALGDQVAVMRTGKIEQIGPFQTLIRQPTNLFVAGFLGTPPMNIFTGGVVAEGMVRFPHFTVPLPLPLQSQVQPGQRLTIGVRPEAAQLITDQLTMTDGLQLQGVAEVVEPDFARQSQLVYLRMGAVTYAAMIGLHTPVFSGFELRLFFPLDQLYFFDEVTEKNISPQPLPTN